MSAEDEVLAVMKKLDKMMSTKKFDGAHDALKRLQSLPITLHVLSKTRVGMTVNSLRKCSQDEQVNSLAKLLIKNWKKLLNSGGATTTPSAVDSKDVVANETTSSPVEEPSTPGKDLSASRDHTDPADVESQDSSNSCEARFPVTTAPTADTVRLKCREMLTNALRVDATLPDASGDPESLAERLEDAIFAEFRNTDVKYKNRVRSRMANLKDMKNSSLRINYLTGAISPATLAKMTPEEMASDEMRALREKFTKEAINDAQLASVQGTKTGLLKCGKCRKRNCTYNQIQTRSADEPMTTFVLCNECGHRWKFC